MIMRYTTCGGEKSRSISVICGLNICETENFINWGLFSKKENKNWKRHTLRILQSSTFYRFYFVGSSFKHEQYKQIFMNSFYFQWSFLNVYLQNEAEKEICIAIFYSSGCIILTAWKHFDWVINVRGRRKFSIISISMKGVNNFSCYYFSDLLSFSKDEAKSFVLSWRRKVFNEKSFQWSKIM